jgi:hypothetical protein
MEEQNKTITVSKVLAWIFGVIFLLAGINTLRISLISGIIIIISSAFLIPPVYNLFKKYTKISLSKNLRVLIVLILLIISGSTFTEKITDMNRTTSEIQNSGDVIITDEYQEIINFTGKGNQDTESFYVNKGKVKITATTCCGGSSSGTYSAVSLKKEAGGYTGPGLSISTEGPEKGEGQTIYRNLKEGRYYIQVISGVNWTVKVEQSN